jgi:hypothetical protein
MDSEGVDYLARHEARLVEEGLDIRLLVGDQNVLFIQQTPAALRAAVNRAIDFVADYFKDNLKRSNTRLSTTSRQITSRQIEQVAIRVALRHLYQYNSWRSLIEIYRDHDLILTTRDLLHPSTRDEILFYCEKRFPEVYQVVAASLLGTTAEEFAEWEKHRRAFWSIF